MQTFTEYKKLREANLDQGTNPADMRMGRPPYYDAHQEYSLMQRLISKLQDPKNQAAISAVLAQHPQMADALEKMISQAILNHSGVGYYQMSDDAFGSLKSGATAKAKSLVGGFKP